MSLLKNRSSQQKEWYKINFENKLEIPFKILKFGYRIRSCKNLTKSRLTLRISIMKQEEVNKIFVFQKFRDP